MIKFEDLNDHDGNVYYIAPNEDPFLWREMIKHRNIRRAAAICSAGEVGFFSILPLVRRELVLVDHSYKSLSIAMLKYLLLQERGWRDAARLLTSSRSEELEATLEELKNHLPERVRHAFTGRTPIANYGQVNFDVQRMWKKVSPRVLQKAARKLDRVSFVHGDLTDLVDRGPFDMLYLSNALEHVSRTGRSPLTQDVQRLVKSGGYVVSCSHYGPRKMWKTIDTRSGSWTYDLYQIPMPEKVAA